VVRGHHGLDDAAEVARDEHVGQGPEEGAERAVAARRRGDLLGADLVRAPRDRDGPDPREVRLVVGQRAALPGSALPRRCDFR